MVGGVISGQIFLTMVGNLDFIGRLLEGFEEGSDQIRFFFWQKDHSGCSIVNRRNWEVPLEGGEVKGNKGIV